MKNTGGKVWNSVDDVRRSVYGSVADSVSDSVGVLVDVTVWDSVHHGVTSKL